MEEGKEEKEATNKNFQLLFLFLKKKRNKNLEKK